MKKIIVVVLFCCTALYSIQASPQSLWKLFPSNDSVEESSLVLGGSKQLAALRHKTANLNPEVLRLGFTAYLKAKARGLVKKQILTIIDYSKPSSEPRLIVLDLQRNNVMYQLHVAHGKTSGGKVATYFSNRPNSLASSLGVFLTGQTYQGKHGYSLRLNGLERGFNDNALSRAIVVHGSNYVSENIDYSRYGRIGRSWGCPAVSANVSGRLINLIKDGSVIFAYYPDQRWLSHSSFLKV
jgi:hypothetical protein